MTRLLILFTCALFITSCIKQATVVTEREREEIRRTIQQEIDKGIEATRTKNIELYMSRMPEDLVIYDESGTVITRDEQRANALRDWSIIDTTLDIGMAIDSIHYTSRDSIIVFTSQHWERIMYRRDGISTDTVLTTQIHRETWKLKGDGWYNYEVVELGGKIYLNGQLYTVN